MLPTLLGGAGALAPQIDRHALVQRHNIVVTQLDGRSPIQVGNGEFAFGMDITGLQTFVPFNTLSQWGFHSSSPPSGEKPEDFEGQEWDVYGRKVWYPMADPKRPALSGWLAANPHKVNLGRVGLVIKLNDGSPAKPSDLTGVRQELDLWTGVVTSRFKVEGAPVTLITASRSGVDAIGVKVMSSLLARGQIKVFFASPGNDPRYFADYVGDWTHPARLAIEPLSGSAADLTRQMGDQIYRMRVQWEGGLGLSQGASSDSLKVIKAIYGAGAKWVDVTAKASEAVSKGEAVIRVNSSLAPDPAPGQGKRLSVVYQAGDTVEAKEAAENEVLHLSERSASNRVILTPPLDSTSLSFTCEFTKESKPAKKSSFASSLAESKQRWGRFWKTGGAIDLSGSSDPRAIELERRVILSQYLMGVNAAGSFAPQESGLVSNTWYGRPHMEMYWWHCAQWALWDRWPLLDRSIGIYNQLLPGAKLLAAKQGYLGARWPKCVGPNGSEWPHEIHALLAWQQPHPIFLAELDYRAHPTKATLQKWWPVIEGTADFMASVTHFDPASKRSVLGPPIHVVSENTDPRQTLNPAFELAYWRFGLRAADRWRERLDLPVKERWAETLRTLAPLPIQDGLYVLYEGVPDMWTRFNFEHPGLTGAYGILPGEGVDRATMGRTLDKIKSVWRFDNVWGWDFPMLAMCAARLGRPDEAVDFLLYDSLNFRFDGKGLASGGPFPYFPSNGGLLYAVAMMARGWDGAPKGEAPGFPSNGKWKVRSEGLMPAP